MSFLDDYDPVENRIEAFWKDHPKGRLETELVQAAGQSGDRWIVKAFAYRAGEAEPAGTGYAFEVDGQGNVNKSSALENCETSAVGRALAQMGYAPKGKRPSREEMTKVAETSKSRAGSPRDGEAKAPAPSNGDKAASPPPLLNTLIDKHRASGVLRAAQSVLDGEPKSIAGLHKLSEGELTKVAGELEGATNGR